MNSKNSRWEQMPLFKLTILGLLALAVLIIGAHLRDRFHKAKVGAETEEKTVNVTEGSPSIGIPITTSSPSEKLQEMDNAIMEIVAQSDKRLLSLPNGSTGVRFQDTSALIAIGGNEIGPEIPIIDDLIGQEESKQPYVVFNTDPGFALTLLKKLGDRNEIEIAINEIKLGETIVGIQKVPQPAIWTSRVISLREEVEGQRWFEAIKTTTAPPPEFSGIAVDSSGKLVGIIHHGRILSRNFIRYWVNHAARTNAPGFAAVPAWLSPVDNTLSKYLNINGMEVERTLDSSALQSEDILLELNRQPLNNKLDLARALRNIAVGDTVPVTLLHNNEKIIKPLFIIDSRILSFSAHPEPISLKDYLNIQAIKNGSIIFKNIETGSLLFNLGLRSDDKIIKINNQTPHNWKELAAIINDTEDALLLRVATAGKQHWIAIPREILKKE